MLCVVVQLSVSAVKGRVNERPAAVVKSGDQQKAARSQWSSIIFIYIIKAWANNNNNNYFMALCPGLPGWAGTRRNTHPPTILIIFQSLSASSIYHDPLHPPCSNYMLGNLFAQPLSVSSLVYLLDWSPPPHIDIPYISSPNQCLFLTAHAHTIATCFAVVSILYHLFLVFLLTPYLEQIMLKVHSHY